MRRLVLVFLVLIVYGSLYPFSGWSEPPAPLFSFLFANPARVEKADLVQNVLAYMPFGLFMVAWLMRSTRFHVALVTAAVAGGVLSLSMEAIQQFLPSRDASRIDLVLNIFGSVAGGLLASLLHGHTVGGPRLVALRAHWLRTGTLPNLGLAALALWALSQTSPLVPTFDIGQVRHGLALLYGSLRAPETMQIAQLLTYACYLAGLGLLARTVTREDKPALLLFGSLVACVLVLKIIVEGRQLSLEAVAGAFAAWMFLLLVSRVRQAAWMGIGLIGAAFVISELAPGPDGMMYGFNWIPLVGQMRSLSGLQNILEIFWPFFAIAYFARSITPIGHRQPVVAIGTVAIAVAVFWLEWSQQGLPGRFGDITQVLLACAGWIIPWTFSGPDFAAQPGAKRDAGRIDR
ncbi:VanZ family protein [Massilia sp. CCM 8733]|uniref:VanZ family protein n=1 Tax=Massilia mucilaginosa TaxID=2609282 RepID=A0ABX0NX63_9BURK|nr:VanZ family protein [Massilia mucilaginosa]NHZ91349.1 VanZ family protein [Massilia mucilaginosa]